MMAEAAAKNDCLPNQMSFKHTLQLWLIWRKKSFLPPPAEHIDSLFLLISGIVVGNRPGRIEPRAIKRRPKSFALLRKPRAEARADVIKYGHLY